VRPGSDSIPDIECALRTRGRLRGRSSKYGGTRKYKIKNKSERASFLPIVGAFFLRTCGGARPLKGRLAWYSVYYQALLAAQLVRGVFPPEGHGIVGPILFFFFIFFLLLVCFCFPALHFFLLRHFTVNGDLERSTSV